MQVQSWIRKIPCTRARQPTLVFLPGESQALSPREAHYVLDKILNQVLADFFVKGYIVNILDFICLLVSDILSPVFLPGESHEQRSLVGYRSQGHKASDTTEVI